MKSRNYPATERSRRLAPRVGAVFRDNAFGRGAKGNIESKTCVRKPYCAF